jgi:hypothetical protein
MSTVLASVLLVAFAPWAFAQATAQEKPKELKERSPSEVVKQWVSAAAKRDMEAVTKLASKTTPKQSLMLIEQQGFLNYQGEVKIIHEELSGSRAIVVYRLENRDAVLTAEIRYDMILLVREDQQWKVAEQGGGVLKPGKEPKR